MIAYGVRSTIVLPSTSPVLTICSSTQQQQADTLFVVQKDAISLIVNANITSTIIDNVKMPVCLVRDSLVVTKSDSTMSLIVHTNGTLQRIRCHFNEKLNCLSSNADEFYSSSGARVHRHDLNGNHQLLRTFSATVKALAASDAKLLVLLPDSLHLLNPLTNQDLVEVVSDVSNPIDIFWSVSFQHKVWFAAHIQPEPMSVNREHRLLMAEIDDTVTSKDITPVNVETYRSIVCRLRGNKLVTLANNGNTLLVYAVKDFGLTELLYRAEATDIPFTAVEIIAESKGRLPPKLAVGTSNGAVALFCRVSDINTDSKNDDG